MDQLKTQVKELSATDWQAFFTWCVVDEKPRRENMAAVEVAQVGWTEQLWDEKPELKPAFAMEDEDSYPEWKLPATSVDGYPTGARVSFDGRDFQSVARGLNWKTPTDTNSGWVEVTNPDQEVEPEPLPDAEAWQPDTDYVEGDLVEHDGVIYRVSRTHRSQASIPPHTEPWNYQRLTA